MLSDEQKAVLDKLRIDFKAFLDGQESRGMNPNAITFVVVNSLILWYLKKPNIDQVKALSLLWSVSSRSLEGVIEEELRNE